MGTEAFWIPAAIAAVGAGAGAYADNRAAKRAEDISQRGIQKQSLRQREADQRVNDSLSGLEASSPDAARQESLDGFLKMLRANKGQAGGASTVGGDRFKEDTNAASAAIKNYGGQRADNLSRITAPGTQRVNENVAVNRTNSDIEGIARNARADAWLNQLKLQSVRADPWIKAGGQFMTGLGAGMAGAGWGTGASSVAGNASKFAGVMDTPAGMARGAAVFA